jgi:hypothetical protein
VRTRRLGHGFMVLLALASVLLIGGDPARATTQSAARCDWIASVPPAFIGGQLTGVAAPSGTDVWASGWVEGSNSSAMFHWDGKSWRKFRLGRGELNAVTAPAADDAWAVGVARSAGWIEHWDGRRWTRVRLSGLADAALFDVAASAPDDVWAVGITDSVTGTTENEGLLALHWDGRRWRRVVMPPAQSPQTAPTTPPITFNRAGTVSAVAVRRRNDAWAVGATISDPRIPLVWHWNGQRWRLLQLPNIPQLANATLTRVAIISPSIVWVAGHRADRGENPVVLRWDDPRWDVPRQPLVVFRTAFTASPTGEVWVAQPLRRWDGREWLLSRRRQSGQWLAAIASASDGTTWAVGYSSTSGPSGWRPAPLALHHSCP